MKHGEKDWLHVSNVYAEYTLKEAGLDEDEHDFKTEGEKKPLVTALCCY